MPRSNGACKWWCDLLMFEPASWQVLSASRENIASDGLRVVGMEDDSQTGRPMPPWTVACLRFEWDEAGPKVGYIYSPRWNFPLRKWRESTAGAGTSKRTCAR